jgi:hypothetical protein
LAEIQEWIQEEGLVLREDPDVGAAIHKHILQADFGGAEIATYICDPTFHPQGTSFILEMLPGLLARTWDVASWKTLRDSICRAVELGLLGVGDLQTIIEHAANGLVVKLRKNEDQVVAVKYREGLLLVRGIFDSLKRSKVLKLADLDPAFLSSLFSKLEQSTGSGTLGRTSKILWDLTPWIGEADAAVLSRLMIKDLRNRCRDDHDEGAGHKLADRLRTIAPTVLRLAVLQTTENVLVIAQESPTKLYKYLLYHWMGALEALGVSRKDVIFTKDDWVVHDSRPSNLTSEQRLMALAWTFRCLCGHLRRSPNLPDRLQAMKYLDSTSTLVPDFATSQFLQRAVVALSSLPLPDKRLMLRDLKTLAKGHFPVLSATTTSSPGTSQVAAHRSLSIFLDDGLYEHAQLHCNDALIELAECLNHNLSLFRTLSRRLIWKSSASFDLICRMLDNNTSFKISLSRSFAKRHVAPTALGQSGVQSAFSKSTFSSHDSEDAGGFGTEDVSLPTPDEVSDLFSHLAVSFSLSNVATPRQALRRVYWCYLYLHRYGGRINPILTQALWHAGVARSADHGHGEHGSPKTFLRWILAKIEEVEGEYVAKQLLWSPSFRAQRRKEMEELGTVDDGGENLSLQKQDRIPPGKNSPVKASTNNAAVVKSLPNAEKDEENLLLERLSETLGERDTACGHQTGDGMDLQFWQKIRYAKTDVLETPFWHEKAIRKRDWEKSQGKTRRRQLAREAPDVRSGP